MKKLPLLLIALLHLAPMTHGQALQAIAWNIGTLSQPVAVIQDPTNSHVQFVVQQGGAIRVLVDGLVQGTNFLNISVLTGSERGLLGMCFDPNYATNGYFYVNYTRAGVYMQLSRFTRSTANPLVADAGSELRIMRTLRPFTNHNAGSINFGADGYLYMPTGDGGSGGDPGNRAQNPNEILGKMVRIDPRSDDFPADPEANYAIPADNPFVDNDPVTALKEIWAFGYRNPWRFSFDDPTKLGTGAMLVGDVGQDLVEEVDYEPAGKGGRNYGWSRFEGNNIFNSSRTLAYEPHQPPITTYSHSVGSSITGGFVYRGLQLGPEYFGRYFFADYVAGKMWSIGLIVDPNTGEATANGQVEHTSNFGGVLGNISSFGVDSEGELFAVRYSGGVYKIARPNYTWLTDVGRTDGIISSGQVRSLIASDSKLLEIQPFSAFATPIKTTSLLVGSQSNIPTASTMNITFLARANQPINVNGELLVKNWATNSYDSVQTFTLNGTLQSISGSTSVANHRDPATGRMEFKVSTSYSGLLVTSVLKIQYDQFGVVLN